MVGLNDDDDDDDDDGDGDNFSKRLSNQLFLKKYIYISQEGNTCREEVGGKGEGEGEEEIKNRYRTDMVYNIVWYPSLCNCLFTHVVATVPTNIYILVFVFRV